MLLVLQNCITYIGNFNWALTQALKQQSTNNKIVLYNYCKNLKRWISAFYFGVGSLSPVCCEHFLLVNVCWVVNWDFNTDWWTPESTAKVLLSIHAAKRLKCTKLTQALVCVCWDYNNPIGNRPGKAMWLQLSPVHVWDKICMIYSLPVAIHQFWLWLPGGPSILLINSRNQESIWAPYWFLLVVKLWKSFHTDLCFSTLSKSGNEMRFWWDWKCVSLGATLRCGSLCQMIPTGGQTISACERLR